MSGSAGSLADPSKPGRRNRLGLEINQTVFWASAALVVLFVAFTLLNLSGMTGIFDAVLEFITGQAGWFFVLCVNVYLAIVLFFLFSRHGRVRLGGDEARPDFSYWGWLSMLFSAGMGIGLMFWSVAEPIYHFDSPPWGEPRTAEAARLAMGITFFHWGFHAWGLYGLMALALAYFAYNRGLPLTVRSTFYPLLGERIHGLAGDVIDILATLATIFGLATSLGLGAQQVNAGFAYLFDIPQDVTVQVGLIAGITAMATISVVLGVDRGIRRLSQLNVIIACLLLLFVMAAGPTRYLLDALVQNFGIYIQELPRLSFWTEAYRNRLAARLDPLLLGLVDRLVSFCRDFCRPCVARPHSARIRRCHPARTHPGHLCVADRVRECRTARRALRRRRHRRGCERRRRGCPLSAARTLSTDVAHRDARGVHRHHLLRHLLGFGLPRRRHHHRRRPSGSAADPEGVLGFDGGRRRRRAAHGWGAAGIADGGGDHRSALRGRAAAARLQSGARHERGAQAVS